MIERSHYQMLMHSLTHSLFHSESLEQFQENMEILIRASYEINTEEGRCEAIDVTGDVIESMGRHWQAITDIGFIRLEFLRYSVGDDMLFEGGRMEARQDVEVSHQSLLELPTEILRAFAKAVTIAMRKHDVSILKRIMAGETTEDFRDGETGVNQGLADLIKEFLDEEVDEAVAKFSSQLDTVFGVPTWSPPKGGDTHDLPPPA